MSRGPAIMRWVELQQRLQQQGFTAAILLSRTSVYYYAGTGQPCNLLIPARGKPILFARRAVDFVRRESWLEDIRVGADFSSLVNEIKKLGNRGKVGIEDDVIPARLYCKLEELLAGYNLATITPWVLEQRLVKNDEELALIKSAGIIFRKINESIKGTLKPGMTELDVAGEIAKCVRRNGGEGVVFQRRWDAVLHTDGLAIAGENNLTQITGHAMTVTGVGAGKIIPWGSSDYALKKGDLLVVDLAINYYGYHIDMARTYVLGSPTYKQIEVFENVKAIQDAVLARVKPGVTAEELWLAACQKAKELGVREYFQGYGKKQGKYVGHATGLEFDEPPTLAPEVKTELAEGMVLCIEPKLIIPGWGAIDLEDTIVVTPEGFEFMCPEVDRKLIEV